MKKVSLILVVIFCTVITFAQSPEKMSYQAVIRDNNNQLIKNQTVGLRISIIQNTPDGNTGYSETQTPTTNANGLISIEIGGEDATVVSGSLNTILWEEGPYYILTETDPLGGTSYTISGTSQLLSVPYALYAKSAGITTEVDPIYSVSQAANISASDISNLSNLSGTNTGDQDLSNLATQSALEDTAIAIRADFPDVSGIITTETDPVFSVSQAANIDATDITNLSNLSGTNTGDQDLSNLATQAALEDTAVAIRSDIPDVSGFITSETDPVYAASQASNINATDITNLGNLSGTNTGDQDLSNLATQVALEDTAIAIRSDIPDVSGFITSETDPVYAASQAANIDATDITNLGNLSGTNTGDQDLSNLATLTALEDTALAIRSDIPDVSGFISAETDPVYAASQAANIDATDITNLANLSGTNTGDQDLSSLATQSALEDTATAIRSDIPDVSGFISAETDPVYAASQAANIDATDITNLGNLSGTNTGDQDLSSLATQSALEDSVSAIRASFPEHYIGELYGGGIIFWIAPNGQNGLIASLDDLNGGVDIVWSDAAGSIGLTAQSFTDGSSNTSAIISQTGHTTSAAGICDSYAGGGYTDWYLPSTRELVLLVAQDYMIDYILDNDGDANTNGFSQEYIAPTYGRYWASTETAVDMAAAYHFNVSYIYTANNKVDECRVRAIRAF